MGRASYRIERGPRFIFGENSKDLDKIFIAGRICASLAAGLGSDHLRVMMKEVALAT